MGFLLGCPRSYPRASGACQLGNVSSSADAAQRDRFGVQNGGGNQRTAVFLTLIPMASSVLGAGWLRVGVDPGPSGWTGSIAWDPSQDQLVALAHSDGLKVFSTLTIGHHAGPIDAWRAFVRQAVARYPADAFEIWNEPDLAASWDGTPAQYAAFLRAAHEEVQAARPGVPVLLGGLSLSLPGWDTDAGFLAQILADPVNPAAGNFEIANFHAYAFTDQTRQRVEVIRSRLAAAGNPAPRIWITEAGYGTEPPPAQAINGWARAVRPSGCRPCCLSSCMTSLWRRSSGSS